MPNASNHEPCPPFRRRSRQRAGAVALLCLASQLLGFAHLLVVRHATCLEHDEVVHAAGSVAGDGRGQVPEGAQAGAGPATSAEHGDHCLVVASRRSDAAGLTAAPVRLPPAGGDVACLAHASRDTAGSPVPLLHLAPKSSPPRASVV